MGRRKRLVDPVAAEQLANRLRELFDRSGFTCREFGRAANYDSDLLNKAINGTIVASWAATWAIVNACSDHLKETPAQTEWENLWSKARGRTVRA